MHDDSVAMSRWLCHAAPGAIGETTAAVCVFAGRNGSQAPMLEDVTEAVTEALDEIFDAESTLCANGPHTEVDAAADGDWLTVRLRGQGRWPADATETHLRDLADRVELSLDEGGDTMTVLFEFPSRPDSADVRDVGGTIGPCPASGRRRRAAPRALSPARRRPRC